MKVNVCLVCFKTFDVSPNEFQESEKCDLPLLYKFLKFTKNCLKISTEKLLQTGTTQERESFCEKCELAVVNPVCQLYQELLSVQLRLAWELRQMGRLLENSQSSVCDELKLLNNQLLATQLGIRTVDQLEEFRSLLTEKCKLEGRKGQPEILVERAIQLKFRLKREIGREEVVPPNHAFPVPERLSSPNDEDTKIDTEFVIKLEPIYNEPEPTIDKNEGGGEDEVDPTFHPDSYSDSEESNSTQLLQTVNHPPSKLVNNLETNLEQNCQPNENKDSFSCHKCLKVFSGHVNLRKHITAMHSDVMQKCRQCSASFRTIYRLQRHITTTHKRVQVQGHHPCPHCKTVYTSSGYLRKHIRNSHSFYYRPTPKGKRVALSSPLRRKRSRIDTDCPKCKKCGKAFGNEHLVQLHTRFHHQLINCNLCQKTFTGKQHWYRHVQRGHKHESKDKILSSSSEQAPLSKSSSVTSGKHFSCRVCPESFISKIHLKLHVDTIHNTESYACPHCDSVLLQKASLDHHIRNKHPGLWKAKPTKSGFAEIFKLVREGQRKNSETMRKSKLISFYFKNVV